MWLTPKYFLCGLIFFALGLGKMGRNQNPKNQTKFLHDHDPHIWVNPDPNFKMGVCVDIHRVRLNFPF